MAQGSLLSNLKVLSLRDMLLSARAGGKGVLSGSTLILSSYVCMLNDVKQHLATKLFQDLPSGETG